MPRGCRARHTRLCGENIYNPFDLTKVWPKKDYSLIKMGVMELNRYPDNYFAEVEQAAFSPAYVVPGIGFSPDKMLQARLFSSGDTQRYRLGVKFNHIPVNAPKCPYHSYHRDGQMRTDGNLGGTLSFHPNSAGLWANQPDFAEMPVDGDGAHWDHRVEDDHWEQPGKLFRIMTPAQRQALFENSARAMGDAAGLRGDDVGGHCECEHASVAAWNDQLRIYEISKGRHGASGASRHDRRSRRAAISLRGASFGT